MQSAVKKTIPLQSKWQIQGENKSLKSEKTKLDTVDFQKGTSLCHVFLMHNIFFYM